MDRFAKPRRGREGRHRTRAADASNLTGSMTGAKTALEAGRQAGSADSPSGAQAVEGLARVSLEQLLVRAGEGDDAAFSALYDALAPRVYGLARVIVGDIGHAEDVAQEVFVQLWRTAPRFDPAKGAAATWTMTIAHRRAVDRLRAERNRRAMERVAAAAEGAASLADPIADRLSQLVDRDLILRCLDELTDLQREAIVDAYFRGYTYPEVAGRLGATLSAVKTRIRDGLRNLRTCISA
ncbi:sigma-70 family RNA polymerase sigma factor [Tenggerimyces flavus]|uniref:Sigma-70 family RNA polymerase sigma factor n=1 Tax=Tenggerimyces flavus TaxID=1708749 RepID=A0ABV7YL04_9ACTN|nr:sigma-70 family RNA polymerase sigma factor [Tenggerimyces flavus]MBM7786555.1 RNA polymerase sigma-70 factor (ECF subfamily) [Tenggerimyces flavus]